MESTSHSTQRKITLESFDFIRFSRPDIQCFNELLVQYPRPGRDPEKPGAEGDELTLFRYADGKYVTVRPNNNNRYAIPELELEAALHEVGAVLVSWRTCPTPRRPITPTERSEKPAHRHTKSTL
jgi:hypothetical protein